MTTNIRSTTPTKSANPLILLHCSKQKTINGMKTLNIQEGTSCAGIGPDGKINVPQINVRTGTNAQKNAKDGFGESTGISVFVESQTDTTKEFLMIRGSTTGNGRWSNATSFGKEAPHFTESKTSPKQNSDLFINLPL